MQAPTRSSRLRQVGDGTPSAMVIGHNPALQVVLRLAEV